MSRLRLITVFLFAVFMVLGVTAQVHTQKGVVRKITRSVSDPFIPVQGVQVVVSGQANKASDKNGRFSLEVKVTDKAGSYTLTAVRMPQGSKYMLASPSKGKRLFVSANDLEVSLITPEEKETEYKKQYELLKEKYEEQSLSLRKLRNELNKRLGELNESDVHYARLKVECDSIRKLYLDYINNEDKIDEVIKELAEELALTDYQSLDSLELKIYELKKNGEWKALNDLIRESMPGGAEEAWKVIEQQQRNADAKVEQAKLELARGLSEQQRLIQQRSQWFGKMETAIESFKMQHLNDSVSHYYEILTKAAPTNCKYLNTAGMFEDQYMADYSRAMNYFLSALGIAKNDLDKADSYNNMGGIYQVQGDISKAKEYYEKALNIRLSVYGENDSGVAVYYNNMGGIYQVQGDISRAKEYYEKALNISLSVNGENDLGVAVCYSNIGGIYQDQGDYVNALTYYKKALEIQLSYGEISPDVSTTYNNIGNLYSDQGNKSKALEYYEKSLKIDLSLYREDHPQVATQYYNIGQVYYSQKNYDKALEYNEKALEGLLVNGVNLPLAASAYYNIGVIYYNRKYYAKSLLFLEKSLALDRKILDENDCSIRQTLQLISDATKRQTQQISDQITFYNGAGEIYYEKGDYSKALECFKEALNVELSVYGENNPTIAASYNRIGKMYFYQKEYPEALIYFEKALKIWLPVYDKNYLDVAGCYGNIGMMYAFLGNNSKALMFLEKALAIYRSTLGEEDNSTKETLEWIKYVTSLQAKQSFVQ